MAVTLSVALLPLTAPPFPLEFSFTGDANKWRGVPFLECSGKTGENIREVFHLLLKEIEKDGDLRMMGLEGGRGGNERSG